MIDNILLTACIAVSMISEIIILTHWENILLQEKFMII